MYNTFCRFIIWIGYFITIMNNWCNTWNSMWMPYINRFFRYRIFNKNFKCFSYKRRSLLCRFCVIISVKMACLSLLRGPTHRETGVGGRGRFREVSALRTHLFIAPDTTSRSCSLPSWRYQSLFPLPYWVHMQAAPSVQMRWCLTIPRAVNYPNCKTALVVVAMCMPRTFLAGLHSYGPAGRAINPL